MKTHQKVFIECDCGNLFCTEFQAVLRPSRCRSCVNRLVATVHGGKGTTEHNIWKGMRARVKNVNKPYLKRGIKVCERWKSFQAFFADMGARPGPDYTIERINNDGNYEPENCRWATHREQMSNTSRTIRITLFGETKIASEWSRDARCTVPVTTLLRRIHTGWPIQRAILEPSRLKPCEVTE